MGARESWQPTPISTGPGSELSQFTVRVLIVLVLTALFTALGLLLVWGVDIILLAVAGILIAVLLHGLATLLQSGTRIAYGWSLALVVLGLLALVAGGGWILASETVEQFDALSRDLAASAERLERSVRHYRWGRELLAMSSTDRLASGWRSLLGRITGTISTAFGMLADIIVILFVGLYTAASPGLYRTGLIRLVPPARRARAEAVLGMLGLNLRWWLLGRVSAMAVVGVVTWLGLWLFGVPLALALGLIAFALDFIPFFGPVASAIPALLVAATVGGTTVLYVGLLYLGVQAFENYVLTPLIQQNVVKLPPALTILAQVLMGSLVGILGLALATPLCVVGLVLVQQLYVADVLGESEEPLSESPRPA